MKRIVSLLALIIFTFILTTLLVAADGTDDQGNTNDPTENGRANACYDGGTLEGKCDSQLMWDAGWFLIRFEYGILTRAEIPAWVSWVLPAEALPEKLEVDMTDSGPGCLQFFGGYVDFNGANILAHGAPNYSDNACTNQNGNTSYPAVYTLSGQPDAAVLCLAHFSKILATYIADGVYYCGTL